jgi:hypothetical protein
MTRKKLFTLASLVAAGTMLGGLTAGAQQQAPQAAAPSTPKDAGPTPGGGAPSPEGNRPFPVMFVTSVELIRSERSGGMDIVRARGLVTSNAWGELPIAKGHPYKGIRVRSGYNAVSLKTLPGFAEVALPKEDCAKCLGKYFQAKGAAAPAGQAAGNVVKEEDLPYPLRIVRPTDGIPSYQYEPNRLTLVLSEAGQIVDAAWD